MKYLFQRKTVLSITIAVILTGGFAKASEEPAEQSLTEHDGSGFGVMNSLNQRGLNDPNNETWNLYGQYTYIHFSKPGFHAKYTNLNGSTSSLLPNEEESFTQTMTVFFGTSVWNGGELFVVPEAISEATLSNLKGIGGATENFELQKTGSPAPTFYRSRLFLRQTVGLGGDQVSLQSGQMQLGKKVDGRRLVFTIGNFSFLDVFDKNNVIGDLRKSFFDEAFMTYAAWDFPADARGYSDGLTAELYWDDWTLRVGRLMPPQNPNQQSIDSRFFLYYGDTLEIEHDHEWNGQAGAVRLLLYDNYEVMGKFDDAVAAYQSDPTKNAANCGSLYNYGSNNSSAPDLCFVRKPQVKTGIGINFEQNINPNVGVFFRGMYSDGRTEVDAYDSADRSANIGALFKGGSWKRPLDLVGVGIGTSWISDSHAKYLAMGGVDGFIGDGNLKHASENLAEIFYSLNVYKTVAVSVDYQFIQNPAYNADRGPVNLYGWRLHGEF